MAKQIFRKSLLERISSPDQLDKMIVITSPSFWLAVIGGAVIIAVVLAWSIFGTLPMHMETTGVLVSEQTAVSREMESNEECWNDWILCDNPYAQGDKKAVEAGACKYLNFIAIVLKKK